MEVKSWNWVEYGEEDAILLAWYKIYELFQGLLDQIQKVGTLNKLSVEQNLDYLHYKQFTVRTKIDIQ